MKKNKLNLDQLKVKSFTTSDSKNLKGGFMSAGVGQCNHSDNCEDPIIPSMDNGIAVFCRPPLITDDNCPNTN